MVVVVHVTVTHVDENLGANEIDMVRQTRAAQALIKFLFGGSQGFRLIIVEPFGTTKPPEGCFNWAKRRRQRRTHQSEAFVCIRLSGIELAELLDDRFKFAGRYIVILHLDMNSGRLARLNVSDVDVAGALEEKLMKGRFQQPHGHVTRRIARLEIESLSSVDTSHRLG